MFTFFEVGGRVRDELLGLQSKDIDYVAVYNNAENFPPLGTAEQLFKSLEEYLRAQGFQIFLVTPECYTIRAKFPINHMYKGVADFVLARKEIGYIEGTRTPIVVPGTLYDDLERRDFTVNAMAKDHGGTIIDFFGGQKDLEEKILRTPLPCDQTFSDDPLRILRALRFIITKGFHVLPDMHYTILDYDYVNRMPVVSNERIYEELKKMFEFNTTKTLEILTCYNKLTHYIFEVAKLKLKPVL